MPWEIWTPWVRTSQGVFHFCLILCGFLDFDDENSSRTRKWKKLKIRKRNEKAFRFEPPLSDSYDKLIRMFTVIFLFCLLWCPVFVMCVRTISIIEIENRLNLWLLRSFTLSLTQDSGPGWSRVWQCMTRTGSSGSWLAGWKLKA